MAILSKLAAVILNPSLLGIFYDEAQWTNWVAENHMQWLGDIVKFIDGIFVPIMIILGAVGAVWCIFLGVNLARAETADKADEAKKRLINVIIAVVASALLIFLFALFVTNVPAIFG